MAAQASLREFLAEVKRTCGRRVRDLVVAAPISAFETYRAEAQGILRGLGVGRVRLIDEPLCLGRPVLGASGPGPADHRRYVNSARLMLPIVGGTMRLM